ncbi:MAG TPA: ribonuclease D [Chloroflexi bacterium]|nr:ribonuclease D [Chloroflexota bacterium]|tara:strand:- start:8188 stop:9324 length:1137 start_codon:yes stop_codon:yes gene_type:complete
MRKYQLVTTQKDLCRVVEELNQEVVIGVDTEANSLHAYQERVCLIQISTSQADFIVDPILLEDLTKLKSVFENNKIEKVFHAAEYDLMGLWRDYGWKVTGLFDTMIAARFLGWNNLSLASILWEKYSVRVDKKFQLSNWAERPLIKEQLFYAQLDTRFLLDIRDSIIKEFVCQDQWLEIYEEFDRIARASCRKLLCKSPQDFWKISGARSLPSKNAAVLFEVYKYRDKIACRLDVPPFRILRDHVIMVIARECPTNKKQLGNIRDISARQVRLHYKGILEAVSRGLVAKHPDKPKRERVDQLTRDRYQSLKLWRKNRAINRGVSSDVIVAKEILWDLAVLNPVDYEGLKLVKDLGSWRRKTYGKDILRILQASIDRQY